MVSTQTFVVLGALAKIASAATASTLTTPALAHIFFLRWGFQWIASQCHSSAVFDRFIQIWLENTDFATAASQGVFQNLSTQGITLSTYYGVTHSSEPNYIACVGGDFFGLASDDFEAIPTNISTIVDLLDGKSIGWAEYQENMPTDGYQALNFTNPDNYTYYVRKHNPLIIYNSLGNNTLPQWIFVTPNLRDDGHDTDAVYMSDWLSFWLLPLLQDPNFNTPRTLILMTFDETETYTINNQVYSILLGGVIPANLKNTTDDTFYTHYSTISTIENNWNLGNLGRQDTNKTLANVFKFVAYLTGYENNGLAANSTLPLLNITATIPGPLNPDYFVPYLAPSMSGVGGGNGSTYVAPGTNMSLNASTAPAPVNLTASSTSAAAGLYSRGNILAVVLGGIFVVTALIL